jgi:hypothetical protein
MLASTLPGKSPAEQEIKMKRTVHAVTAALGMILLGAAFTATASAGCGDLPGKPTAPVHQDPPFRFLQAASAPGAFAMVAYGDESIVGLWQVTLTAMGNGTAGPPDGTPIDAGYSTWHADGTELNNSMRDPSTGSFCQGVWMRVGYSEYKLNHFGLSWVPASPGVCTPLPGNVSCFLGPANIHEDVTVDETGNNFTGTFTIDQYDQHGNNLSHVAGTITGKRITVD